MQNLRGFLHLHHESALPANQIVACADARKNAINKRNFALSAAQNSRCVRAKPRVRFDEGKWTFRPYSGGQQNNIAFFFSTERNVVWYK